MGYRLHTEVRDGRALGMSVVSVAVVNQRHSQEGAIAFLRVQWMERGDSGGRHTI